jgi:hypothetical protein
VSADGEEWGDPVAAGAWRKDRAEREVTFAAAQGRYVRLVALSEVNGKQYASAAEINVLGWSP